MNYFNIVVKQAKLIYGEINAIQLLCLPGNWYRETFEGDGSVQLIEMYTFVESNKSVCLKICEFYRNIKRELNMY